MMEETRAGARADLKLSQTMGNVSNIFKYNAPFKTNKKK